MRPLLLAAVATVCFASTESLVSLKSLREVEAAINDKMRSNVNEPYDLLGTARGTYLAGYGAVFSVELNLVMVSPLNLSPFKPGISEDEINLMEKRKLAKVETLKDAMRSLMVGAGKTLTGLPPEEHIVMEAFLFNYRWERTRDLPNRIVITSTKQQLLDAAAKKLKGAEFTKLFDDQEL